MTGFSTDKTRALLAYLSTEDDGPHRRQALAGLLWPDYPERSARTSLRTALANLRQVIGDRQADPPFLLISHQAIAINPESDITVDAVTFSRLLDKNQAAHPDLGDLEEAAELYRGPFLKGFSLADSTMFEEWLLLKREWLERQVMATLGRLTTIYKERGDHQTALIYARRRLELDPWREPAQRELMWLLAASGRRAAALAQYEACQRLLAEEFGVEPERKTIRLYEKIRDGKLRNEIAPSDGPLEIRPSLPAFLSESAGTAVDRQTFVGRDRELRLLRVHLEEAVGGRGRVVFVVGGAGRGKTVLLEEFVGQAMSEHEILAAMGYCNAYSGGGDPYLPFRHVLQMLTGDVEDLWADGRITKQHATLLWKSLRHTVQAIVDTGPGLIETFLSGRPLLERAIAAAGHGAAWLHRLRRLVGAGSRIENPVEMEQQLLIDQYVRVLERVAEHRPLLIILEDLHWADRGSIELLLHMGRRLVKSRVLILCAYRPDEIAEGRTGSQHPLAAAVNELRRLYGEVTVDLAVGNPASSRQFVDELLDSEPNRLSTAFRQELHNRTRGYPLFTVEMLRMLQEQEDLVRDAGGRLVEGQELAWDRLPARVEAVIEKRIDRLEPLTHEMLSVASVEGEEFSAEVIAQVLNKSERQVLRTLSYDLGHKHRLLQEGAELKTGPQYISRFRFSHHLIQRYVYDALSDGERRLLHEQVARALEDLFASDSKAITIQLAYHYSQTGVTDKATHFLTEAGHQARARYDARQAIRYYSEALSLLPDDHPDRFRLLEARAAANDTLAQREAQRADIEAMDALATSLGDQALHCDALLALTDFYLVTEPFRAGDPAEQARQIAGEIGDSVREAHALRRLAWAGRLGADFQTSLSYIEKAAEQFEAASMPGEAARCLFMLARRLPASGEHFFELQAAERAMALSQESDDYRLEAVAHKNLAIAYMNWERYSEALLLAEEALERQRDVGDRSEECNTLDALGVILARLGRQQEVAETFRRCLAAAEAIGSDWGVLGAVFGLWNYWYVPNGEYEPLLEFVDERMSKAHATGRGWLERFFSWVKRLILAELGQLEAALASLQWADHSEKESDPVSYVIRRQSAGFVKIELGDLYGARQDLEKALELAQRVADPYLVSWPLVSLANLALMDGEQNRLSRGIEHADKAAEAARTVREERQLSEALNVRARLYLALGQPAQAFDDSSEVMRLVESNPYLPRPQNYFHTHSLALRSLGREGEANHHLQRAYERVMFVADKFTDESLRYSWLESVRANGEIVTLWSELGLGRRP